MKKYLVEKFLSRILLIRFLLSLFIFFAFNIAYREVFDTVGYMYEVKINISYVNLLIGCFLLYLLIHASDIKNSLVRHGFDICILGIYLPIAVMCSQINSSLQYMLYPFFSVLIIIFSFRIFQSTNIIKSMSSSNWGTIHFSSLQVLILILYTLVIFFLLSKNLDAIGFNLIETYLKVYELRAEKTADGLLGYFIGWFVILFFPLFLSQTKRNLRHIAPLVAFIGALYVFQEFGVKVIFLNFFLISIFAFFYQRYGFNYLPYFFFLFLLFINEIFGLVIHPLLDRFFYLIGLNSIFYFDFFSSNPLRFFEGSKLDFGISNYGIDPGFLIDDVYYQGLGTNQSAGFLPTMFSDLGVIGVMVSSVLIGGVLSIINSLRYSSDSYAYLVMVAFSFSLMNHSFNMLFLTNGLFFTLLFALFLKRRNFRNN